MPIVRRTTSALGNSIVPSITKFIQDNADAAAESTSSTPEEGAKALSHAIAYGIAKAFGDPTISAGFAAGISLPTGGPVGALIINAIKPSVLEI